MWDLNIPATFFFSHVARLLLATRLRKHGNQHPQLSHFEKELWKLNLVVAQISLETVKHHIEKLQSHLLC
jgi:hypothetical protein